MIYHLRHRTTAFNYNDVTDAGNIMEQNLVIYQFSQLLNGLSQNQSTILTALLYEDLVVDMNHRRLFICIRTLLP